MDLHDEQKENIRKERYYESLIGKDYAKGMDPQTRTRRGRTRTKNSEKSRTDSARKTLKIWD